MYLNNSDEILKCKSFQEIFTDIGKNDFIFDDIFVELCNNNISEVDLLFDMEL
jgi:hypothetical protein